MPISQDKTQSATVYQIMVLLVDDQPMVGEAVRRILDNQPNIAFHFCSQASEAIEIAERLKPTVILQDLVLPGIDGLTLVRNYRKNSATYDIPIIVLSTREDPVTKSESFAAGANDYLVKLPDGIELIARIRYHSKAYISRLQRDEAYRALHESQQRLIDLNIELQRLSSLDGLTGLSNRLYFEQFLGIEWQRAQREKIPLSVIMIDVDDFKRYNDTYGHVAGDGILKKIALKLQNNLHRAGDLAARYGGEEFIIILPNTPTEGAQHIADSIRKSIYDLHIPHSGSTQTQVTVSVGFSSTLPQQGQQVLSLIREADDALYQAKNAGKNQVIGWNSHSSSN